MLNELKSRSKIPLSVNNRSGVLRALHKIMDKGNSLSRCCAVQALARINACDAASHRRLIDLLHDADPDVRMDTAAALGKLRIAGAAAALLESLSNDPESDVRIQVVKALCSIRPKKAVEQLIQCVQADGYPHLNHMVDDMEYGACWEIQEQAVKALGQIADQQAITFLIELLEDERYADLQECGFNALAHADDERAKAFLLAQLTQGGPRTKRRAAQALASLFGVDRREADLPLEFVQALTSALVDPDAALRMSAVRALSGTHNPLVTVPITMLLQDPEPEVREAAAITLRATAGQEIIARLHELLTESDSGLQRSVADLLGEIGDAESCQPLSQLLDTDDPDVVYAAVRALGQIGLPGSEQQIASILADENAHANLRTQAAHSLGTILENVAADQDGDATGSVREPAPELHEDEAHERCLQEILNECAFDSDARVSYASLAAMLQAYPQESSEWLTRLVLGQAEIAEKTDRAQTSTTDSLSLDARESPETSTVASILSGQPVVAADVTDQQDLQQDVAPDRPVAMPPDDTVRVLATRLLGNLANPGPHTVAALATAFRTGSTKLRREALLSMGRLGDANSLPALIEGLESKQPLLQLAALDAAGNISCAGAIDAHLANLCKHDDATIRGRSLQLISAANGPASRQCLYDALEDDDAGVCRIALRSLSQENSNEGCPALIMDLMFRFSGALRTEAAAALQRINDIRSTSRLVALMNDPEKEDVQWICIDALAEIHAARSADNTQTGMTVQ